MANDKILIVDNEPEIVQLLSLHLKREGFSVVGTSDSQKALGLIHREVPDIILLDVVMPGMNGIDLCSRIREEYDMPIIFISCKNEVPDKVLGLSMGGDDYIAKPFSMAEVIARIKANLKRTHAAPGAQDDDSLVSDVIQLNGIRADMSAYSVTADGKALNLTSKEFDILVLLMRSPNRVFTPKQIFERLWDTYGYESDYRTVMVHVSNLKKKIDAMLREDSVNPIQNVRSVGYKFVYGE